MPLRIRSAWYEDASAPTNPLIFSRCWWAMPSAENGRSPTSLNVSLLLRPRSWRCLDAAVFLIAPSSLMWMPHAKQHDSALCPVILPCLLQNADSTRSVRQATQGANEGKWYAPAPPLSKCTLANGSAPMGAKGMGSIVVNLPRLSAPLQPT